MMSKRLRIGFQRKQNLRNGKSIMILRRMAGVNMLKKQKVQSILWSYFSVVKMCLEGIWIKIGVNIMVTLIVMKHSCFLLTIKRSMKRLCHNVPILIRVHMDCALVILCILN